MQNKVVIVYSVHSFVRRTTIIPHDDKDVPIHTANVRPGEAAIVVPLAHYQQYGGDEILQMITGQPRGNDRCLALSGNVVDHVLCADPHIDVHPDRMVMILDSGATAPGTTIDLATGLPQ